MENNNQKDIEIYKRIKNEKSRQRYHLLKKDQCITKQSRRWRCLACQTEMDGSNKSNHAKTKKHVQNLERNKIDPENAFVCLEKTTENNSNEPVSMASLKKILNEFDPEVRCCVIIGRNIQTVYV